MKTRFLFFIKYYWKTILWAGFILLASAISGNDLDKVKIITIPHFDKFVHLVLYFIFTLLLIAAQVKIKLTLQLNFSVLIIIILFAFFYSLIMEILQRFVFEARSFELSDLLANSLGILFCLLLFVLKTNFFKNLIKFL